MLCIVVTPYEWATLTKDYNNGLYDTIAPCKNMTRMVSASMESIVQWSLSLTMDRI